MGRPLFSQQTEISAISNESVEMVRWDPTGIIANGESVLFTLYSEPGYVYEITDIIFSLGEVTGATGGVAYSYFKQRVGTSALSKAIVGADLSLGAFNNSNGIYGSNVYTGNLTPIEFFVDRIKMVCDVDDGLDIRLLNLLDAPIDFSIVQCYYLISYTKRKVR